MAAKNRAFLIAFRTLVASLSLLSLLMLSLQAFPKYRSPVRLIAARFGLASSPSDAGLPANDLETSDPSSDHLFSGSVSGDDAAGEDAAARDDVPGEVAAGPGELTSLSELWESRITDLEHSCIDLKMEQAVQFQNIREDVTKSLRHVDSQMTEVLTMQQRLHSLEQQLAVLQETLAAKEAAGNNASEENEIPQALPERISIRESFVDGKSRLLVEARDVSLAELFARLGETLEIDLLVDQSVSGNVSFHLELPKSAEAIKEICRLEHCKHAHNGRVLVISRKIASQEAAKAEPPETMTKLYRLRHLTAAEIRPYVAVLLTPGVGTVGSANVRTATTPSENRDASRAILVKDIPEVLTAVDRLILELDHPDANAAPSPVQATPAAAPLVPPPPTEEVSDAPGTNEPMLRPVERTRCHNCTSIAPPVVTPGPRHIRR